MEPQEIVSMIELVGQTGIVFVFMFYVVGRLDKKIEKLIEAQVTGFSEMGELFRDAMESQAKLQRAENRERDKRFFQLLDKLTNGQSE